MKCVLSIWAYSMGAGGLRACLDGLGHFFPCPNDGQLLVLGGVRRLARMVGALLCSIRQCQKIDGVNRV